MIIGKCCTNVFSSYNENTRGIQNLHLYTTTCGIKNCKEECFPDHTNNTTRKPISDACRCPRVVCSMIG